MTGILKVSQYAIQSNMYNWMEEFKNMGLPMFVVQYIQLLHIPLDLMKECLQWHNELDIAFSNPGSNAKLVREYAYQLSV